MAILTLLSALSISAVAIYYSIAGLAAIFAGAAIPIMIMGSVLEVGKLVTASWLYQNWKNAPRFLKYYLSIAVLVLMFITSMGIFGFLSKAHVEQTAPSSLIEQKIEQIDDRLLRENAKVERFTVELERLNTGTNVRVDTLVDTEQEKLNSIYERIDKEIADITAIANTSIETQKQRILQAKERADRDIKQVQERMKGAFGKSKFDKEIDQIRKNEVAVAAAAQKEILSIQEKLNIDIQAIKDKYQPSIDALTTNISNFTSQAEATTGEIDTKINEIESKIASSYTIIDSLNEEKFTLKGEIKAIEVEVGPIKYIAEFIYGSDPTVNVLEDAVRWVIIIIIFVFDPLAVLLLIAANYSITKRFGKSIEDLAEHKFAKANDNTGVEPDEYWKERYQDMKDQLDRFNKYKETEDEQPDSNPIVDGFDPAEVEGYEEFNKKYDESSPIDDIKDFESGNSHIRDLQKQIDVFKQREIDEKKALEDYAKKAREEDNDWQEEVVHDMELEKDLKEVEEKVKEDQPILDDPTKVEDIQVNDLSDDEVKKKTE